MASFATRYAAFEPDAVTKAILDFSPQKPAVNPQFADDAALPPPPYDGLDASTDDYDDDPGAVSDYAAGLREKNDGTDEDEQEKEAEDEDALQFTGEYEGADELQSTADIAPRGPSPQPQRSMIQNLIDQTRQTSVAPWYQVRCIPRVLAVFRSGGYSH